MAVEGLVRRHRMMVRKIRQVMEFFSVLCGCYGRVLTGDHTAEEMGDREEGTWCVIWSE